MIMNENWDQTNYKVLNLTNLNSLQYIVVNIRGG